MPQITSEAGVAVSSSEGLPAGASGPSMKGSKEGAVCQKGGGMRGLGSAIAIGFIIELAAVALAATPADYVECQQTSDVDRSFNACSRIVSDLTVSPQDRAIM